MQNATLEELARGFMERMANSNISNDAIMRLESLSQSDKAKIEMGIQIEVDSAWSKAWQDVLTDCF